MQPLTDFVDRARALVAGYTFYGNPLERWLAAAGVFLVVALTLRIAKGVLRRRAQRLAARERLEWFATVGVLVERTRWWFQLLLAIYLASRVLILPEHVASVLQIAAVVALLIQAAIWTSVLLTQAIARYAREKMEADAASVTTISALGFLGRVVIWAIALLLVLENIGVDVTAMIAGLGIGGIAVGLAAQSILADLFASASIVLDKPFVLGDFIIVGTEMGTVENIGLKTTRLRSPGGEQLIFSNSDLLKSRIRNAKRMQERRVIFTLGIVHQTPPARVAAVPAMIREAIEPREKVRFERAHFKSLGDSALIFEISYVVLDPDNNFYLDTQQAINLALLERFAREGIELAYPTQTVYMQRSEVTEVRQR